MLTSMVHCVLRPQATAHSYDSVSSSSPVLTPCPAHSHDSVCCRLVVVTSTYSASSTFLRQCLVVVTSTYSVSSTFLRQCLVVVTSTYSVSSWMRLVSTGTWLSAVSDGGTVLDGRLDWGLSGGLGCVSVNGNSTLRSLAHSTAHTNNDTIPDSLTIKQQLHCVPGHFTSTTLTLLTIDM